ncbi:sugar nucleotide-binding protein [Chitinophaga polysaccharea]|uniref:SDR family oxidoreductase n=1 Tax=Chitinophaga polysaccharea TaxID=1293035 RepID=UPI0014559C28|nr:SDR family oxidoreductase [Chitinophaga polysaccharea]NLR57698.1 sugar nucleotide-binding protein [Chitinophaga polysaccharea]
MDINTQKSPELWAGIECTINRVGEQYFSQMERNGHLDRIEDLELFAALGIKKIRYPVLWEQIAAGKIADADWRWADERLYKLQELGIDPIVGFVHHGSGPRHTSLIDADFPDKLSTYAAAFAARYPWVKYYTPVNEPLTTARFSGLYGHWFPHGKNNETFARALVVQCKAVIRSMQAIREYIPDAQLVQTEDICKIFSTPLLAYQAAYENERRWLSLDLLCGSIDETHKMWPILRSYAISEEELQWFSQHPCPPDIIGVNHYPTSSRYLDEQCDSYPEHYHGGNLEYRYADVEALRKVDYNDMSLYVLLKEVWERYQLPIAVTEAHICSGREEQLRWLKEFWDTGQLLFREGVDIRAVTAWSLLGSFDWNSLVTRDNGFYESGVFDIRGQYRRPTALADLMVCLAENKLFEHPVMASQGFWRRTGMARVPDAAVNNSCCLNDGIAPLLIIGATGTLGRSFARHCAARHISYRLISRQELDITDAAGIDRILSEHRPWAVVNAAGYVQIDAAEDNAGYCFQVNAVGPALLAAACKRHKAQLLTFSSDQVFDGMLNVPYLEQDIVRPINIYGKSKAASEDKVQQLLPEALIIRTSAFFSPWDSYNFITKALQTIACGEIFSAANDITVSPTYVPDLVDTCLDLLIDHDSGIRHLANRGGITWAELARSAAAVAGLDTTLIRGVAAETFSLPARRPRFSVLSTEKGMLMPTLDDALSRYHQAHGYRYAAATIR